MGASFARGDALSVPSRKRWAERPDLFADGVGSGDPASDSILLWTGVSNGGRAAAVPLTVEVAEDAAFTHARAPAQRTSFR